MIAMCTDGMPVVSAHALSMLMFLDAPSATSAEMYGAVP